MLKNMIKIKISGKNINRFVDKMYRNKIDILDLEYIDRNQINIKINYSDYNKIEKIRSIYNYEIIDSYGKIKIRKIISINKYLILFILFGILIIYLLSNIIFNVDIATDNKEMKELIISEMRENKIYKYSVKKKYKDIKKIIEKIKYNNKNRIEWLDIKIQGTRYIVNLLERKEKKNKKEEEPRNIIAKKSGIIKNILGSKGVIVENVNNYVNKGDIIISGEIKNNEVVKDKVAAEGTVYAEVWYKVEVEFPLVETKTIKTDKFNQKINFKIFNNYLISGKFKDYLREDKVIYKNLLLPFSIVLNKDQKVLKKDNIYIPEEAIDKAYKLGIKKIEDMLEKNEYIILKKKLNYFIKGSTIELEIFFKVYEDITDYGNIAYEVKE